MKIDPQTGCMTSLFDKRSGTEALAPAETDTGGPKNSTCGNLLQTFVDKPQTWDAGTSTPTSRSNTGIWTRPTKSSLIESGPLRAVIRDQESFSEFDVCARRHLVCRRASRRRKDAGGVAREAYSAEGRVPAQRAQRQGDFEIPFGSVERPTTRNTPAEQAQFEVPAQRWADISDAKHGFSLLNDCKYGYDAKGNVLRLSLLRSPEWPDPHADEGHHEFTYSLYPHARRLERRAHHSAGI